jgi:Secretion system C-terminal sorting domain
MKILLVLCLHLILYSSLHSQMDSSFYFPMKMGNLWQYKEPPPPDDPYITEIRTGSDTTFSNGHTYGSFVTKNYGYSDTIGAVRYERQIGNKVYQYFPKQQQEFVIYDFSKNVGDTVSIFPSPIEPGDTNVITVLASGIQNIFGMMRKYVTFYNKEFPTTLYWIDQITDSIGITSSQIEPGYQLYLVGTIVDNIRYGTITSVTQIGKEIPNAFMLYQNFPNPFNSSTVINYYLPNYSFVVLDIYDVLGRKVKTVVAEYKIAGNYSASFDGSQFPSGVYFCRLTASNYTSTRKMGLIR